MVINFGGIPKIILVLRGGLLIRSWDYPNETHFIIWTRRARKKKGSVQVILFGNVGAFFATTIASERPHWKIIAVSDPSATLQNDKGLSVAELAKYKENGGKFSDFVGTGVDVLSSASVLSVEVDVMSLAALGGAITVDNNSEVKAKYILELANGPVDADSGAELLSRGVEVVPDIIANAGGVIVSYLEWQQNMNGQHWSENEVNMKLAEYIVPATKSMIELSEQNKVSLKKAAFILALKQLLAAK